MPSNAGSPFLDPDDARFKGPVARPRPPPLPGVGEPVAEAGRRRRVLGVGRTIGLALAIWLKLFFPLTAIALLVYTPLLLLGYWHDVSPRPPPLAFVFDKPIVRLVLDWLIPYQLASAMIGYRVVRHLEGRKTGLVRSLLEGLRRSPHVLVAGFLSGMGTMLAFAVVIFPGLILYTTWYVSIPAAVVERRRKLGTDVLYRSGELTEGEQWAILGVGVTLHVVRFIVWVVMIFVVFHVTWDVLEVQTRAHWAVVTLIDHGLNVLLLPPLAIAPAVAYYLLRTNREGLDPERLSEIFD